MREINEIKKEFQQLHDKTRNNPTGYEYFSGKMTEYEDFISLYRRKKLIPMMD